MAATTGDRMRPYVLDRVAAGGRYSKFGLAVEIIIAAVSVLVVCFSSLTGLKRWFGDWAFGIGFFTNATVIGIVVKAYWEGIQEMRRAGKDAQQGPGD